ncbi:hypothetical protein [Phaffia rhodozyma]|uniref:Uncharacterized protein n=1 Tax=Phaffia rhodozyma TaxID=264483 RepID=A0A0F7SW48_PHARH|nr:hypothetical protein [Phaffia rhodozyma]
MPPLSSFLKGSYFTKTSSPDTADTADKATGSSVVNLSGHANRAEQPPPAFSNEICPPSYTPVGVRRKIIVRRKPGQDETDYALIHAQLLEKAYLYNLISSVEKQTPLEIYLLTPFSLDLGYLGGILISWKPMTYPLISRRLCSARGLDLFHGIARLISGSRL